MKYAKNIMIYVLIVLAIMTVFQFMNSSNSGVTQLSATEFYQKVESNSFSSVAIVAQDNAWSVEAEDKEKEKYTAVIPPDESLVSTLDAAGTKVEYAPDPGDPWWMSLLVMLVPMLIILGVFFFMMNQSQGGGSKVMQFGKSRARMQEPNSKKVTFADVAGIDEVEEELQEVVDFLKDSKKYSALGAKIPKGVLLYGYPGTGKTLVAKAVAGEAGVPFFSISGSDFVEMFVGVGASRVRDLFGEAKKNSPCIVFIDEIDAVGRQRGAGVGGGHDEREQTLNQLLVEMDGFSENSGIIVIAATNRPDILDPALLRPGRFDRQIAVGMPDVKGREQILQVHCKGKPLADDVNLSVVAKRTPGFTGADLANLVNEAALLSARRNKTVIHMSEMEEASERVIAGPEKKSKVVSENEKKLTSYHEAGHAVAAYYSPNADPVHKISIIPRGRAGGYTLMLPDEDRNYMTKTRMLEEIVILLGGRLAEALVLKDISTGAQNDLERATSIVRKMIMRYGMSDALGLMTFGHDEEQVFLGRELGQNKNYSEEVAGAIDRESRRMMDEASEKCRDILTEHMDQLHLIAKTLYEKETIEAEEFTALMEGRTLEEKTETARAEESEISTANADYIDASGEVLDNDEPSVSGLSSEEGNTVYIAPDASDNGDGVENNGQDGKIEKDS